MSLQLWSWRYWMLSTPCRVSRPCADQARPEKVWSRAQDKEACAGLEVAIGGLGVERLGINPGINSHEPEVLVTVGTISRTLRSSFPPSALFMHLRGTDMQPLCRLSLCDDSFCETMLGILGFVSFRHDKFMFRRLV